MTPSVADTDSTRHLRWAVYCLLIALAVGQMMGRLMAVNSVDLAGLERHRVNQRLSSYRSELVDQGLSEAERDAKLEARRAELQEKLRLQRPFLSANDRSRWMAVRALVEYGVYEIDPIVGQPTWGTIDMVKHVGPDGEPHLYSSKPPLLIFLVATPYWVLNQLTGWTLADDPYLVGRTLLVLVNILPMALMLTLVAAMVDRLGRTDEGRLFVVAAATLGTLLLPFSVVLNNHIPAAVAAGIAIYCWVRIRWDQSASARWWLLAGLAAAFAAANELPALAFLVFVGLLLLKDNWQMTLKWFTPAALVVVAAFFATNYEVHQSLRPPYMHRSETDATDNWYDYQYEVNGRTIDSYWNNRQGIDVGEESVATYCWHTLVGHHGIFSITPVWLLILPGMAMGLFGIGTLKEASRKELYRELAALVASLTVICLIFFIALRPQDDRNYGGVTSGLRWMFWFTPLWLVVMVPAADWLLKSRWGQAVGLGLLAMSSFSAAFPTWNPWSQPWIYQWMQYCGWPGF